jgi:ubiquitin-conjugating enzyme E2 O
VEIYPLERLTKLYDGIEQIEDDLWGDDPMDIHGSYEDEDQVWSMDENGMWQPDNGSEWEEFDDDTIIEDDMDVDTIGWADEVAHDGPVSPTSSVPHDSALLSTPHVVPPLMEDDTKEELTWKGFDILSCAPRDHAYFSSIPSQPSKSFLGRLTKEYRVLSSSLPGLYKV